ncbi:MAG: ABC transporter permease [Lachnospiraceae bacterium]|nr:ABC transporter permease [Lachnospiraceae bacterium]
MSLLTSILASTISVAVIMLYATIGEIISQRAGIMNLGLEGIMLMGAVSAYFTVVHTHSLALAILTVIVVGALLGLIYAFITVTLQANQVVAGLAMMTFGSGLSGFIGNSITGVAANLKFESLPIPLLSKIPVIGKIFFSQNLLVYILYVIVAIVIVYIYKTRPGMTLRALGENPGALDAVGINVFALRYVYCIVGTILVAMGGAYMSIAYSNSWQEGMTGGYGWIAAALVVFSAWNPAMAVVGSVLFGFISIIGNYMQAYFPFIPVKFVAMLPYIFTIIVLILTTGNFRKKHTEAPAALCVPYDRESR